MSIFRFAFNPIPIHLLIKPFLFLIRNMSFKHSPTDTRRKAVSLNQLLIQQTIKHTGDDLKPVLIQPFKQKVTKNPRFFYNSTQKVSNERDKLFEENLKLKMSQHSLFEDNLNLKNKLDLADRNTSNAINRSGIQPSPPLLGNQHSKYVQPRKLDPLNPDYIRRRSFTEEENERLRHLVGTGKREWNSMDSSDSLLKTTNQESRIKELETQLEFERIETQQLNNAVELLKNQLISQKEELKNEKAKTEMVEKELFHALEKIRKLENPGELKPSSVLEIKHQDFSRAKTKKIEDFEMIEESNFKMINKDIKAYGVVSGFIRKLIIFIRTKNISSEEFVESLNPKKLEQLTYSEFRDAMLQAGFRSAVNEMLVVFDLLKEGDTLKLSTILDQLISIIEKDSDVSSDISSPISSMTPIRSSFDKLPIEIADAKVLEFVSSFSITTKFSERDIQEKCENLLPEDVLYSNMVNLLSEIEFGIAGIDLRKKIASYLMESKEIVSKADAINTIMAKLFGENDITPGFAIEISEPITSQIQYNPDEFIEKCRSFDIEGIKIIPFDALQKILTDLRIKFTDVTINEFKNECLSKFKSLQEIPYESLITHKDSSYNRAFSFAA